MRPRAEVGRRRAQLGLQRLRQRVAPRGKDTWGQAVETGDVIGRFVDLDAGEIKFSLNGTFDEGMGTVQQPWPTASSTA